MHEQDILDGEGVILMQMWSSAKVVGLGERSVDVGQTWFPV
jgi:hypothetical protein